MHIAHMHIAQVLLMFINYDQVRGPNTAHISQLDNIYLAAVLYWQHWSPFNKSCCSVDDIRACGAQQLRASGVNAAHYPILSIQPCPPADMCDKESMILVDHGIG